MWFSYYDLEERPDGSASMFPTVRHVDDGKKGNDSIMSYLLHGKAFEPNSMHKTEFDTKSRVVTVWVLHKAESEADICAIAHEMQDKVNGKVCGAHEVLPCNVSFYRTTISNGTTLYGYRGQWTAQGYIPDGPEIIFTANESMRGGYCSEDGKASGDYFCEGIPKVSLVRIDIDAQQIDVHVHGYISSLKERGVLADVMTRIANEAYGSLAGGYPLRVSTYNVFEYPKGTDMEKYGTHYGIWVEE